MSVIKYLIDVAIEFGSAITLCVACYMYFCLWVASSMSFIGRFPLGSYMAICHFHMLIF